METPCLDIVIVTWNSERGIAECLHALEPLPKDWRITVIDNNSYDRTADLVRSGFPNVNLIVNEVNVGFARANNQVIARTISDHVLLLNPDTIASVDAVRAALEKLSALPAAGVLGVRILNADGELQPSCQKFPSFFSSFLVAFGIHLVLPKKVLTEALMSDYWDHDTERLVDSVLGAFMVVSRKAINKTGIIPDQYFMYYEETDWCYRMWQNNFEVWFTPKISIVHHGNRSAVKHPPEWRTSMLYENKYKFCRTNYGRTRTTLIQAADLVGFTLRRWYHSLKPSGPDRENSRSSMKLHQEIVWKAFRSGSVWSQDGDQGKCPSYSMPNSMPRSKEPKVKTK